MGADEAVRRGRRRDASLDDVILDAVLEVLADLGYERTTIDLVAERAGAARATVYRRWATKSALVRAAVERLSVADANAAELPDTGTLRGDLIAAILPLDDRQQAVRIQAVVGLMAMSSSDETLAGAVAESGLRPWIEVGRTLIRRAVERGEYPGGADIDVLAAVIPTTVVARAAQRLPITLEACVRLIDGVVLPALRGSAADHPGERIP